MLEVCRKLASMDMNMNIYGRITFMYIITRIYMLSAMKYDYDYYYYYNVLICKTKNTHKFLFYSILSVLFVVLYIHFSNISKNQIRQQQYWKTKQNQNKTILQWIIVLVIHWFSFSYSMKNKERSRGRGANTEKKRNGMREKNHTKMNKHGTNRVYTGRISIIKTIYICTNRVEKIYQKKNIASYVIRMILCMQYLIYIYSIAMIISIQRMNACVLICMHKYFNHYYYILCAAVAYVRCIRVYDMMANMMGILRLWLLSFWHRKSGIFS